MPEEEHPAEAAPPPLPEGLQVKVLASFIFIDEGVRRALKPGDIVTTIPARILPGLIKAGKVAPDEAVVAAAKAATPPPRAKKG